MEDGDSSVFGGLPKLVSHGDLNELKALIQQTQIDLLTSIESLATRIATLERRITQNEDSKEMIENVFDVVSREELGLADNPREEIEVDYKDDEIRIVESGFTAPPPEDVIPEGPEKWADNIMGEIAESGGSINLYWKRRGLIPSDISEMQKVEVKKILEQRGVKEHKADKMRRFYYISEDDGEDVYNAFLE